MSDAATTTERALIDAARSGDRTAIEALVTRYEPHVFRFGVSMCGDADEAREVLQDTFLAMVRSLKTFRADSSLSTWLYAIAHHACMKRRRRRVSAPRQVVSLDDLDGADRERLASPSPSPEVAVATHEQRTALDAAIASLDPAQRVVLLLRDVEGLSAPEAAEALGVSVAAVKSRLHRARVALRATLAPLRQRASAERAKGPRCPDVLAALSRHLDGDLSAADCAAMEAHIEGCHGCRTACEAVRQVLSMCRASPLPVVPASTRHRLREAIRVCLAADSVAPPGAALRSR